MIDRNELKALLHDAAKAKGKYCDALHAIELHCGDVALELDDLMFDLAAFEAPIDDEHVMVVLRRVLRARKAA